MSRAELERRRIAGARWPNLAAFVASNLAETFFQEVARFNSAVRGELAQVSLADLKLIASEARDFVTYFQERTDDIYFVLDGLNASVPPDKIPYEGEEPGGVRRMKLLYAEAIRLVRKEEENWEV